jgi:hypothetical protein
MNAPFYAAEKEYNWLLYFIVHCPHSF